MNIAATPAEIARLQAITKPFTDASSDAGVFPENGCAFGCHFRHESGFEPAGETMRTIAVSNNIELRSDVLRRVTKRVAADLIAGGNTQVGVIQFSEAVIESAAPTTDSSVVETAVDSELVTSKDTNLPLLADSIAGMIGVSGTGRTSSDRKQIAILVTDGAMGGRGPKSAIDSSTCDTLKSNGVEVAVIYVRPFEMSGPAYDFMVKPYFDSFEPALRSCATSADKFFDSQLPDEIEAAFATATKRGAGAIALRE